MLNRQARHLTEFYPHRQRSVIPSDGATTSDQSPRHDFRGIRDKSNTDRLPHPDPRKVSFRNKALHPHVRQVVNLKHGLIRLHNMAKNLVEIDHNTIDR